MWDFLRDFLINAAVTYAVVHSSFWILFHVSYYIHEFDAKWTKQEYKAFLTDNALAYYDIVKGWLRK